MLTIEQMKFLNEVQDESIRSICRKFYEKFEIDLTIGMLDEWISKITKGLTGIN